MLGNTICILDNFTLSLYPTFSVLHFHVHEAEYFVLFSSPLSPSRSLFSPISRNQTCIAFHFDHLLEYCFYQFLPGKMQSLFLHFWFCLLEHKVQMKDDFTCIALSWGPHHNIQMADCSQNWTLLPVLAETQLWASGKGTEGGISVLQRVKNEFKWEGLWNMVGLTIIEMGYFRF